MSKHIRLVAKKPAGGIKNGAGGTSPTGSIGTQCVSYSISASARIEEQG